MGVWLRQTTLSFITTDEQVFQVGKAPIFQF